MKVKLGPWLVLAAILTPIAGRAETLGEVLAKHYEARGGLDRIKSLQSARLTGHMSMGPITQAPVTLEWKRPDQLRMEFVIENMTGVMTFDGKVAWTLMPFMGRTSAERLPEDQLEEVTAQADFDGPLVDYEAKGHKVEYVGAEQLNDTQVHTLRLTKKSGDVSTIYLDAVTYLEARQEGRHAVAGRESEFEVISGDYKKVDGLTIAHSVETRERGAPGAQTITIDKIELNPKLDGSRFTLEGAKAEPPSVSPGSP